MRREYGFIWIDVVLVAANLAMFAAWGHWWNLAAAAVLAVVTVITWQVCRETVRLREETERLQKTMLRRYGNGAG